MDRSICTRRMLSANDYAVVEQCSCGSVHVTIGAVTLRLQASAIPELAATLGEAAAALQRGKRTPLSLVVDEALS